MFSGKTGRLIAALRAARDAGRCVLAVKHVEDRRYAADLLATHDGRSFPARTARSAAELEALSLATTDSIAPRERSTPFSAGSPRPLIAVDEAQFFDDALVEVCRRLAARGVEVVVAGIDHDAWGRPFPPLPRLKELADEVCVLTAACTVCGSAARFSQRVTPVVEGRMVGGAGDYEPRCGTCFVPLAPFSDQVRAARPFPADVSL